MDSNIKLLVTIFDESGHGGLIKVALNFPYDIIPEDLCYFPESLMEPENVNFVKSLLPAHISSIGPIAHIERIAELVVWRQFRSIGDNE